MKQWNDIQKMEYDIKLHKELHDLYVLVNQLFIIAVKNSFKMIVENPYSKEHYLYRYWCIKPSLIDNNRRERGDYYVKPTQYWFVNCEPKNNLIFEAIPHNAIVNGVKWENRRKGDYEPTEKERENARKQGLRAKGRKLSEEVKQKISESHFKGGIGAKKRRSDGYIYIYFPEHPKSTKEGMIMEHQLVMECYIGRWLNEDECVHHINHKRDDNRLCNLRLMTKSEHMSMHMKERFKKC